MNDKIITERGPGRALTPYAVNVTYGNQTAPGTGADWFGPLQPLRPIAPPEVAGRAFDYVPGYNLNTEPRPYEPVSFASLRALADAYDPVRLIIEHRKDQLVRLPWTIRLKHEGGSKKRPATKDLPASTRGRIEDITAFFRNPDFEVSFRSWLRQLAEDLFVIDAPSLFCDRSRGGDLRSLQIMDGATIKVVIDDRGRLPRPFPWKGGSLMWNGEAVTTDNFAARGFKHERGLIYPPAYQQILKGLPAVNYTTRDMIYKPLNLRPGHVYGRSPVESIITTVSTATRRAQSQFEYYREGNQPEAIYSLPESWTPDQVQRFQDYWDNLLAGNLAKRRQMKFIAGGGKKSYVPIKEPPLTSEMDEWLIRICCFAFSYPPSAFVTLSNRSIADSHEKQSEEEGVEPVKNWSAELINDVISREFDADDIEFAWVEEDEIDQEKQSQILSRYVDSGILTLNQARERIGEEPDPNPAANALGIRTATGRVLIGATPSQQEENENDDDVE
jgi:portal protein